MPHKKSLTNFYIRSNLLHVVCELHQKYDRSKMRNITICYNGFRSLLADPFYMTPENIFEISRNSRMDIAAPSSTQMNAGDDPEFFFSVIDVFLA